MRILKLATMMMLAVVLGLCALGATPAQASHFRSGTISWAPVVGSPGTVEFSVRVSYRRSYFGAPNVGDTFSAAALDFGDGGYATGNYTVTSADATNDVVFGEEIVQHTYASAGPFTAFMGSCCRVSDLGNGAGGDFYLSTSVTPFDGNSSPVSNTPPTITVAQGNAITFQLAAADPDGDTLNYRLADPSENGGISPPANLSINAITGVVTWDNSALDATVPYGVQFIVADMADSETVKTSIPVDLLLRINTAAGEAPTVEIHTQMANQPQHGPITVPYGTPIEFVVEGFDADVNATVTLNASGLPIGSTMTPSLPVTGVTGVSSTFGWTPALADIGTYVISFTATDDTGLQGLGSMTVNVTANINTAPELNPTGNKSVYTGSTLSFTVQATDADAGQTLTYSAKSPNDTALPAGASFNSATGAFSWTPTAGQAGIYSVTLNVDDGNGGNDTEVITIVVIKANTAPLLPFVGARTIFMGSSNTLNFAATDTDVPANTLVYSLVGGPAGASINSATGVFSWTPTAAQANPLNNFYLFKVRVSDNGLPGSLSDEETAPFTVMYPAEISVNPMNPSAKADNTSKSVTLVYTVRNNSKVAYSNLKVDGDVFWPATLQSVVLTPSVGTTASQSTLSASSKRIQWTIPSLPAGTSKTLSVKLTGVVPLNTASSFKIATGWTLAPISGNAIPATTSPQVFLSTYK